MDLFNIYTSFHYLVSIINIVTALLDILVIPVDSARALNPRGVLVFTPLSKESWDEEVFKSGLGEWAHQTDRWLPTIESGSSWGFDWLSLVIHSISQKWVFQKCEGCTHFCEILYMAKLSQSHRVQAESGSQPLEAPWWAKDFSDGFIFFLPRLFLVFKLPYLFIYLFFYFDSFSLVLVCLDKCHILQVVWAIIG